MGALTILVTGAGGFLGREVVAAARRRGHRVRALVRRDTGLWAGDAGVQTLAVNLGWQDIGPALAGVDAVIHAAAKMDGPAQEADTTRATAALLAALPQPAPRFVLVSSLSVYAGTGGTITEDTLLEPQPDLRDAYCRAKLAQEAQVRAALTTELWVMRPGALLGPGRVWNGHIGIGVGPLLLRLGAGEVPVCQVIPCAEALVLAAETPTALPRTLNLTDADRPDAARFVAALRRGGWPKAVLPLPWQLLGWPAALAQRLGFAAKLPGLLRLPVLRARLMPQRYDSRAAQRLLGWTPGTDFDTAMQAALAAGGRDA